MRLFYLSTTKGDVAGDIAVMKRAAERAKIDNKKAEVEKKEQDLFVDRLVERLDGLRQEIAMYDAQFEAQRLETKRARLLAY